MFDVCTSPAQGETVVKMLKSVLKLLRHCCFVPFICHSSVCYTQNLFLPNNRQPGLIIILDSWKMSVKYSLCQGPSVLFCQPFVSFTCSPTYFETNAVFMFQTEASSPWAECPTTQTLLTKEAYHKSPSWATNKQGGRGFGWNSSIA